jgi:hypothetical protein
MKTYWILERDEATDTPAEIIAIEAKERIQTIVLHRPHLVTAQRVTFNKTDAGVLFYWSRKEAIAALMMKYERRIKVVRRELAMIKDGFEEAVEMLKVYTKEHPDETKTPV